MVVASGRTENSLTSFMTAAKSGVRKAADALRMMSASAVRMEVISAGICPTACLSEIAGSPEDLVVGVYIRVTGDMQGHALFIYPHDSALLLVDMVTGQPVGTTVDVDEMEQSVLKEIGNIMVSSYLNAISDFYRCSLLPTPPSLAVDMGAAVVDSVLLNTGRFEEDTISVVTKFAGTNGSLRGFFLYIPELA